MTGTRILLLYIHLPSLSHRKARLTAAHQFRQWGAIRINLATRLQHKLPETAQETASKHTAGNCSEDATPYPYESPSTSACNGLPISLGSAKLGLWHFCLFMRKMGMIANRHSLRPAVQYLHTQLRSEYLPNNQDLNRHWITEVLLHMEQIKNWP